MTFAMSRLDAFFLPIAQNAGALSEHLKYEPWLRAIGATSRKTDAVSFHSKNLTNTLELRLFPSSGAESLHNGLGPGFVYMAHMRAGLGKTTKCLSDQMLLDALSETTRHIQRLWPWQQQVRQRHTQSIYCESQKLLNMGWQGRAFATIARVPPGISFQPRTKRKRRLGRLVKKRCNVEKENLGPHSS